MRLLTLTHSQTTCALFPATPPCAIYLTRSPGLTKSL